MGVTLYKPGSNRKIKGIRCDMQVFEGESVSYALENGWSYSPEECYKPQEEIKAEDKTEDQPARVFKKKKKIRHTSKGL